MNLPDAHLDLGCGKFPRNPYGRRRLCGVDIRSLAPAEGFEFRGANLAVEPIPFEDDSFGSVSAFDFIEHVPRILATADGRDTFFPFIRLMNEAWRVLAPGGLFYAVTPAFPNPEIFVDPTHVNFITDRTHEYFCGDNPLGRMYGFSGHFEIRRVDWVHKHDVLISRSADDVALSREAAAKRRRAPLRRVAGHVRETIRTLRGRPSVPERFIYFLWELEAVKSLP